MDLNDILSYQPARDVKKSAEKRPAQTDDGADRKRRRLSPPRVNARSSRFDNPVASLVPPEARVGPFEARILHQSAMSRITEEPVKTSSAETNGISEEERERILKMVEEAPTADGQELDATNVKKMLLVFERKVLKNREMRVKFPDNPQRFLDSEVELNDEIQQLHALATVPEHYGLLVECNACSTLVNLLSHDNSDIALAVVDLLLELTDVEAGEDEDEGAEILVGALLDSHCLALLVQNMDRFDEKIRDEADGVHTSLGIVENMCEFKMETVCAQAVQQGLMHWLVKRVKSRGFDANKLYASEILAILLQNSNENRRVLGDLNGVDILLQSLAVYKRRDPASSEEVELMENLFDCLCLALMQPTNRGKFLDGEGPQLMILMLKEKKQSFSAALKVLDHALANAEGADNCTKFVEVFGLRTLFPIFMKTPKKKVRRSTGQREYEEHICSLIASLFRSLTGNHRQRLLNKFKENDFEKVDRLMELHENYHQQIILADRDIEMERRRLGDNIDAEKEDDFYLQRLDAGLFTLQRIDYIVAEVAVHSDPGARQRVYKLLSQHGDSTRTIKRILREYADNVGDAEADTSLAREAERRRIADLLSQI